MIQSRIILAIVLPLVVATISLSSRQGSAEQSNRGGVGASLVGVVRANPMPILAAAFGAGLRIWQASQDSEKTSPSKLALSAVRVGAYSGLSMKAIIMIPGGVNVVREGVSRLRSSQRFRGAADGVQKWGARIPRRARAR